MCLGNNCPQAHEIETAGCVGVCDVAEWRMIYSQQAPSNFAKINCKLNDCYYKDDDGNFINFDGLVGWPKYEFKLEWDDSVSMTWTQTVSPLAVKNTDMNPHDVKFSDQSLLTPLVPKLFKAEVGIRAARPVPISFSPDRDGPDFFSCPSGLNISSPISAQSRLGYLD